MIDPRIDELAKQVLTDKQYVAYKLHSNGMTERDMAILFGISRRAVRDRIAEADVKIISHPDYPQEAA